MEIISPSRTQISSIPSVSVIVPLYRCASTLHRCIDSIIGQTLADLEIILVDDGSPDRSGAIADEYAGRDARIRVIHQDNRGPGAARNAGIKIARGEFLGFVDSDDEVLPEMFKTLYGAAQRYEAAIAICSYFDVTYPGNSAYEVRHTIKNNELLDKGEIRKRILPTFGSNENVGYYNLWNKIYLRSWIMKEGILLEEDRDHGEDWWFNIQMIARCPSMVGVQQPLYRYVHQNEASLMRKYRENGFELFVRGRQQLRSILEQQSVHYDSRALDQRFIYEVFSHLIQMIKHHGSIKACRDRIESIISNEEVANCCRNDIDLPFHLQWLCFCIRKKYRALTYISLYLWWKTNDR